MLKTKRVAKWIVGLLVFVLLSTAMVPGMAMNTHAESKFVRIDATTAPYGGQGSWSQNTQYSFFMFNGGGWWSDSWAWMYNGCGNLNQYVDFKFVGTSVVLYMRKMDIGGIAKIYIDGNLGASVDTYSTEFIQSAKVFEKDNLVAGEHTLRVEVAGQSIDGNAYIVIEAFEYMSCDYLFEPENSNIEIEAGEDVTIRILRSIEGQNLSGTYDLVMPEGWMIVSGEDFVAGSTIDNIVIRVPNNYRERYGEIKVTPKALTGEPYASAMTIKFVNVSASVSVIFGTTPVDNGIVVWTGDGSGYTIETYDGKSGWQTKPGYGVIYGNVDDGYIYDGKHKVIITIEYYDAKVDGKQNFGLTYDGVSYPWSGGPTTTTYLTGTNTWKTVTYTIDDVKFANRENGGDFRIHTSVPICFHSITVERIPIVTIEGASSKSGNIFFENEAPSINLFFGNQFASTVELTVNYYVLDCMNSPVDDGTFDIILMPKESKLTKALTFSIMPKGTYTLVINARNSDSSINISEKYNFSVITNLDGKDIATFLGMNTHYCVSWPDVDKGLPLIKQTGAINIRDGREGATAIVDKIISAGYRLLTGVYLGQPDSDGSYNEWAEQVVKPYAEEVKGKAEYFEIGNEPNGSTSPEEYVKMLEAAYPVIKNIDQNIKVVCGVAFGYDAPWLKKIIDLGALDYSDAMSFHIYSNQNPENEGLVNSFQDLNNYIKGKGIIKDVDLLLTETGYATQDPGWGGLSEIMSASYAAQLYVTGFVNNELIDRIYWYDFMNDGTDPTFYETNGGVVRADLTAKPSYVAFNAVSDILAGTTYVKSYNTIDNNIRMYKFHRDSEDKNVIVLWANNSDQYINLNLGSDDLRIADIFGNFKNYDTINGAVTLMASAQPIYIEGNFVQDPIIETTPSFATDTSSVTVAPGNDVTIKINRSAGAVNLSGMYAVDLPVGWQLKSGEQFSAGSSTDTLVFSAPDSSDIKTGEIRIYPTSSAGNIFGVLKVQINIIDPSVLEVFPQLNDSGNGYDIVVKITNRSDKILLPGGKVTVLQPADMAGNATFDSVAPNSAAIVKFPISSIDEYTPTYVKIQIDRDDGYTQIIERNVTSLTAIKADKPIDIEGVLNADEWNDAMSFTLDKAWQVKGMSDWGGPNDLSAKGYIKWDTDYLYIGVSVIDNIHYNIYPPSQNWAGDSIQFSIDPGRAQGPGILPHTENNIALRSDTGTVTITGGFGAAGLTNSIIKVMRNDSSKVTSYEMAISWSDILPTGMTPKSGTDLGFSLLVNDNDETGRRGWIEYMSGIGASKDPTLYGDLILTDLTSLELDDETPPVSEIQIEGEENNGWYKSDVTVILMAEDDISGVNKTQYSLDNGETWSDYSGPVVLRADGQYDIMYHSIDNAGNIEEAKTITVRVDKTAPTFSLTINDTSFGNGSVFEDYQLLSFVVAVEDNLSGIKSSIIAIDDKPYQAGKELSFAGKLGEHNISIVIEDKAGNKVEADYMFKVTTSIASMQKLLYGYEVSRDIKTPLLEQLKNNLNQVGHQLDIGYTDQAIKHMEDFTKHLNSKAMKKFITDEARAVLNTDADALIEIWSK
ncbi:OmpL47-type beta-barrel domain-containing protein [Mahella australiensis]|uniref:Uncharacterized protein n=1 Tax=Mahella australiensis (strain DSM 15567 / CIP 107919 / 50-1 BON) TaxID=697281 RepID=F4A2J4_MAHA5|nr:sugar-binding protein [Mahella australiensis]AEE97260.1 hypothetical protein Mahau_2088 [Mahella australiensis 50-1 BON]